MKIRKIHCLFEQSGTFKNAAKELGVEAEDYDILDDFGETDHQIDLFAEIDKAYDGKPSIFDGIEDCDLILAFFPCTRFECQSKMLLDGSKNGTQKWTDLQKVEYAMKTHEELHQLYMRISKLFAIALRGGGGRFRMIVENPYNQPHYLTGYFPIKPTLIDKDRTKEGDYYKKPTQYWFVNCKPEQNMILEALEYVEPQNIERAKTTEGINRTVRRSMIHPQYAKRFLRNFVLDEEPDKGSHETQ